MSKPPKRKAENKSSSLGSGILRNCQELLMSILNLYINVTFIIIYIYIYIVNPHLCTRPSLRGSSISIAPKAQGARKRAGGISRCSLVAVDCG